jgi:hypothetical protein
MTAGPTAIASRRRIRVRRVLFLVLVAALLLEGLVIVQRARETIRATPVYDPPVLAGQLVPGHCSGGFYARHGGDVVLTASAHCGAEGQVVTAADGTPLGVIGPSARLTPCPHPERDCLGSDMSYVTVAPDHVPWGHLNTVDLGAGGYRVIAEGTGPLACADIALGDRVETNGSLRFRDGTVLAKGENDFANDAYFPCIVATSIAGQVGDSGGAVLVNGLPAGINSREFGSHLAFTPLAEGLEELGLELCTTPDCGLAPPADPSGARP